MDRIRTKILRRLKDLRGYYQKGTLCSIAESAWGETVTKECIDIVEEEFAKRWTPLEKKS